MAQIDSCFLWMLIKEWIINYKMGFIYASV